MPPQEPRPGTELGFAPDPTPVTPLFQDWHQSNRSLRHDAASVWQDAFLNPLIRTLKIPFHLEPRHGFDDEDLRNHSKRSSCNWDRYVPLWCR